MGSKSQLAFIYVRHILGPRGPPVIQDGVPDSYMLAVFKCVAHEESEIVTKFYQGRLTAAASLV